MFKTEPMKNFSMLDSLLACSSMVILGATVILGMMMMREFKWTTRPWQPPESAVDGKIPPGAYHLRMHTLIVDKQETEDLVKVVGEFPPSILPLAVAMNPASELLVKLLNKEGTPLLVIGPGGCLFRIFHKLPLDDKTFVYYGKDLTRTEVRNRVQGLTEKIDQVVGRAAPGKTLIYMIPEKTGKTIVSFPFEIDRTVSFAEAHNRAKSVSGLHLVGIHSDLSDRGCP